MPDYPSRSQRAEIIDGLRQVADYLDTHPGAPVAPYGWDLMDFPPRGTDAEGRAAVDQVAAVLGVTPHDDTEGGHYTAARTFGRIRYRYVHISARRRASYEAWSTYDGAVTPDPGTTEAA
jgi:hypothetical protein